jgi:hypothetical protein
VNGIPVALFAYARPDHLERTLECLRENKVPLIYAFSDGPRTVAQQSCVNRVREMLRAVDWCEMRLTERQENLGLGRSIITGVTEVLHDHDSVIVFEDDLTCVPGTYQYLSAALHHYQGDDRVMSVTGWTHPLVTPTEVTDLPYFDGRAECWVWGTWARSWTGMSTDAKSLMEQCRDQGIDIYKYGADLVGMAKVELALNIWAVRFLYLHMLRRALCLRPPWSMVEHIGFDERATNASDEIWLRNPPLRACPPIPSDWPLAIEAQECASLHQRVGGRPPQRENAVLRIVRRLANAIVLPSRG